ncbi:MAG: TfoX/Sxy family protein [Devosia sp.]|nr:MAG: TfoX/Sxy family protein [Devosia sp.]
MACDELADRIRALLPGRANIAEKKMFGGIAFMQDGNMLVCPTKAGELIVRVGKDGMAEALEKPGAELMDMGGRTMSGFVVLGGDAIEDDDVLAGWIETARAFVMTLPPK